MANPTTRIRPTKSESADAASRARQRSFFVRMTQPLLRVRMSKLMSAKMGRSPSGGAPP